MNEIVIGAKIADGRKSKELSQAQFAELLNVSPQAVSKWERGESLPDIIMLNKIASVIGVDMNHFSDAGSEPRQESKKSGRTRNMSFGEWKDSDFSGIKDLHDKLSCSNVERCQFRDTDLQNTTFRANNMTDNDFSGANMRGCKFSMANAEGNNFADADLSGIETSISNFDDNNFTGANLTGARFKLGNFDGNVLSHATLDNTEFNKCDIKKVVFGGSITDCAFIFCGFKKVEFVDATIKNIFIKGKMKGVAFINCKADKISLAFIKAAGADVSGITIEE
ncbi:MAG: pentapeptide repeat-containing protein [Firmicutes bacterium]|nr:pentapeptide repeat-containing protein [Bacillota bacterium]